MENSVFKKKHDISQVGAEGLFEAVNQRMMKLHMEIAYKNNEDEKKRQNPNFSIEIDETNNMVVPGNVKEPIKDLNFVSLPTNI